MFPFKKFMSIQVMDTFPYAFESPNNFFPHPDSVFNLEFYDAM